MSYSRKFIGKGKKMGNFDMVRVTICMDDVQEQIHEHEGKKYLSFTVASMKKADKFGRTHSAFFQEKDSE